MGKIVAGLASSHAFTFMEPGRWDEFREKNRASMKRRYGAEPPAQPGVAAETPEDNAARYAHIRAALDALRRQLRDTRPDALIVIGDDQNEHFTVANIPQLAVYVGRDFRLSSRFSKTKASYRAHQALAEDLLEQGVREGFDLASIGAFNNEELAAHAHAQVLDAFLPEAGIPVVPIFINAIHYPAIAPTRCYAFGQMLARAIGRRPENERVAICASGGLSHFTAGYPWKKYTGPHTHGAICQDFDRQAVAWMQVGAGDKLAALSDRDLLCHGDVELRSWIALLGALGPVAADFVVYEPFYRALMGMAVASWSPENKK